MKFIHDDSVYTTNEFQEWETFINEREAKSNAKWVTDEDELKANVVRFQEIVNEPILAASYIDKLKNNPVYKFDSSEEAYVDSMYSPEVGYDGTSLLIAVKDHLYPVGESALRGILERGGLKADGFEKLKTTNRGDLVEVLNKLMKATKGYVSVYVQDEKVRAVNSGRYAICPMTFVVETMKEWVADDFPNATFLQGYYCHDFARWIVDLSDYTQDIMGGFPDLISAGFTPAVIITTSNTGNSSVSIKPALKFGDLVSPLSESIDCAHIAKKGTASERTMYIESAVRENFKKIFPSLEKLTKEIQKLQNVKVNNAYNALLRGMKSLGLPKIQAMEAAEQFKVFYPDEATAYECYISILDVYANVARDFPNDSRKQFEAADAVSRSIRVKWGDLGNIPGDFSW